MSAIFGFAADSDLASVPMGCQKAFQSISHYGPDSSKSHQADTLFVGVHLLEVASHSALEAPQISCDGHVLVADAILDYREDLGEMLGIKSVDLTNLPDSHLILRAYQKWGENCLEYLYGDFAFAIIDKSNNSIFLAKDHIGARPLFWSKCTGGYAFSTDVSALLVLEDYRYELSEDAVIAYLADGAQPVPQSFFDGINKVPGGHWTRLSSSEPKTQRWWNPLAAKSKTAANITNPSGVLRRLCEDAVAQRIATPRPIGSHLSGGIDSTAISVMAERQLRQKGRNLISAYSWSPPGDERVGDIGPYDERQKIADLARKEGIFVRFGVFGDNSYQAGVQRPMETEGTSIIVDELEVIKAITADQCRVVLSGWGGDEAVTSHGFGYLAHLLARLKFSQIIDVLRMQNRGLRNLKANFQAIWQQGLLHLLPLPFQNRFSPFRYIYNAPTFMSKEARIKGAALIKARQVAAEFGPDHARNIFVHLTMGHVAMRMETWASWSAASGFQYRYPFLDRRVLEYVISLPQEMLFPDGRSRGLSEDAFKDALPLNIVKADPANERKRAIVRDLAWLQFAEDEKQGKYSEDCPWLDMTELRAAIKNPKSVINNNSALLEFMGVYSALRVYQMYHRFKAMKSVEKK